jgi:large repetitive protein
VVWESQNVIFGTDFTIFARRYSAAGVPLTGELQVSQTTTGQQHRPVVGVDPQGNFVVAWQKAGHDGSGTGVMARRFDAAGNSLGNEFLVNQHTTGDQARPWVDRDAQGRFVVAWQSDGQDGSSWGIFARRFDAAGSSLGNEFRANTTTFWFQERPAVSMVPDGRFILVWQSGSQDGPDYGVYGQRYHASGAAAGSEFRVNTVTTGHQYMPAVSAQPGGGFVVAWAQQESPQTTFTDVWARLYGPFGGGDLIFKDGFEAGL